MSSISICGFVAVFLLVIHSSNSSPTWNWLPWVSTKTKTAKNVPVHKAPFHRVGENQTSLLILLDTTTFEPDNWEILRNHHIDKIIKKWANQPGEPIYDYFFAHMRDYGKFVVEVQP